jgi:hypothetical protein
MLCKIQKRMRILPHYRLQRRVLNASELIASPLAMNQRPMRVDREEGVVRVLLHLSAYLEKRLCSRELPRWPHPAGVSTPQSPPEGSHHCGRGKNSIYASSKTNRICSFVLCPETNVNLALCLYRDITCVPCLNFHVRKWSYNEYSEEHARENSRF